MAKKGVLKMNEVIKFIEEKKILPVVVINNINDTVPLMKALVEGGLPVAEITFRTECAADAIRLAVKDFPKMIIGAGTVINSHQCLEAIACGAKFIVSPGFSGSVASVCKTSGIPYFPGCLTPTEIMQAIECGINTVKFFPAKEFGGLKAIKSLGAAFPSVKFVPTGGVNNSNLEEFLSCDKIFACGGSWLLKGSYDEIVQTVKEAVKIVSGGNK